MQMTKNRMFPLVMRNCNPSQSYEHNVSILDESCLWHIRYDHLPFDNIRLLQNKSMVRGIPMMIF